MTALAAPDFADLMEEIHANHQIYLLPKELGMHFIIQH